MIESLSEDYVRTARAKAQRPAGDLRPRAARGDHAGHDDLRPRRRGLLVSSIFTEKIFGLKDSASPPCSPLTNYDLPLIMGTVIVGAVVLVIMNFIVDVLYSVLDPRVRLV